MMIGRTGFVSLVYILTVLYREASCFSINSPLRNNEYKLESIKQELLEGQPLDEDNLGALSSGATSSCSSRRAAIGMISSLMLTQIPSISNTNAVVTDETENFQVIEKDSPYFGYQNSPPPQPLESSSNAPTDEISIKFSKEDLSKGLGIELGQAEFQNNVRVYVKSLIESKPAAQLGVKKNWIVVSIDGKSTERTTKEGVSIMFSRAVDNLEGEEATVEIRFRDPAVFRKQLRNLSADQQVTTQVAPEGVTTELNRDGSIKTGYLTEQIDQRVSVSQLIAPKMCKRQASTNDLLEISYLGTVLDTGAVFDGSAIKVDGQATPGRANDVSLFFVLGKQPFGQFPPGWDVGLEGMCVGERRRLIIPPVLAYGPAGLPKRGIPPNATLQYDITLVSINGLATP